MIIDDFHKNSDEGKLTFGGGTALERGKVVVPLHIVSSMTVSETSRVINSRL